MPWAPNRSASCPAISRRASFDRSSARLTITVAYVIDLSCVAIRQSLLGSKGGKTTEIDQVAAPLVDEIIRQMLEKCLRDACYAGGNGSFWLERTLRFGPYSLRN